MAEEDCAAGISVVLCEGEDVIGVCALIPDGEPTYDTIEDGEWLTGNENRAYMTVHRIAVSVKHRGTGAAAELLRTAETEAVRAGLGSVRIDTHEGNIVMRRMLAKNGYVPCGNINLANGDRRVAYEKRL